MTIEALRNELETLDQLLAVKGLRLTWLSLLAAELDAMPKMRYILADPIFKNVKPAKARLLEGLSIGEVSILYEYSIAYADHKARKGDGQFFTPDDVALFLVKETRGFPDGVWMDPCSGIGNLSWHLVNSQKEPESFLQNKIVLMDKDRLALIIARVIFTISFQDKKADLFYAIEPNFKVFDFLSVASKGETLSVFSGELERIPDHDFVLVNPPYLSVAETDSRFELASCKDLYGYFLENIMKTSKGFVSITPQSFTNAAKFLGLRKMMLDKFPYLKIYNFDNIPGNIFLGFKYGSQNSNKSNSIRVSVTVAKQGKKRHQITSLVRWKTSERAEMFKKIDRFLSTARLTGEFFPKVSSIFLDLYNSVLTFPKLGEFLTETETDFVLYIPSSPRYFISALKFPVSRTSLRTLYFRNSSDYEKAYMLLNSSYMYWWWRVRDGGMTLALETIKSLPVPEFQTHKSLIRKLVISEGANKVVKNNAGAEQENVKHPLGLVAELNQIVMPKYADSLLLTHHNSELVQLKGK